MKYVYLPACWLGVIPLRSFSFILVNDGLRPPVGPDPGVGSRLLAPPIEAGVGIPALFGASAPGVLGLVLFGEIDGSGASPVISATCDSWDCRTNIPENSNEIKVTTWCSGKDVVGQ
jgi:hypothetical protein